MHALQHCTSVAWWTSSSGVASDHSDEGPASTLLHHVVTAFPCTEWEKFNYCLLSVYAHAQDGFTADNNLESCTTHAD